MPYLIDGHNLIPKVGLRLDAPDDELELIELLQLVARRSRSLIEVFFDGAPAGAAGGRKFGRVTAIFVSQVSTADAAIRLRLRALGGEARNWTVVSSDREVLQAARAAHARTLNAEEFADRVRVQSESAKARDGTGPNSGGDGGMSEAEVKRWLDMFKKPGR